MGANHSDQASEDVSIQSKHSILVVNPNPTEKSILQEVNLPKRVSPILELNKGCSIDEGRHKDDVRVDNKPWLEITSALNKFMESRAELISTRQETLQTKIVSLDKLIQKFTESYMNDKHQALARMNEDCKNVEELQKFLHKCTIQSEICVGMLEKLNFLLPEEQKLEPFEQ